MKLRDTVINPRRLCRKGTLRRALPPRNPSRLLVTHLTAIDPQSHRIVPGIHEPRQGKFVPLED